ncbi:MAG: alkene reductase [Cyanobacteria bacterium P01_C01_bin.89]
MTTSPKLLSPVKVGDLELQNRVVLAPLTRGRAGEKRIPNPMMAEYYAQRANGNLLISEATVISEQGFGWVDSPGIYNDEQVAGWKVVTDAVHAKGGKMILQLWHCGRSSHSDFHNGELPVSSAAVKIDDGSQAHTPNGKKDYEVPRALTTEEVAVVVEDYRQAAERAKAAGFDGVEIHGANGYLIDQFLQSKVNQRDDKYGGSLENRFRFLKEITEAILTVWESGAVGVRLSPNGVFNDVGSPDYRETYLYVVEQLKQYGLGYLHIMDGLGFGFHEQGEPMTLAEFRAIYPGTIIGNCGYTQEAAEEAIAAGNADLIAFGRPYITNPDLINRFANGYPLTDSSDPSRWYSSGPEGYVDYPTYEDSNQAA